MARYQRNNIQRVFSCQFLCNRILLSLSRNWTMPEVAARDNWFVLHEWGQEMREYSYNLSWPLVNACRNGHLDMVKHLFWLQKSRMFLLLGTSPSPPNHHSYSLGYTSLMTNLAAGNGHLHILEYLYLEIPHSITTQAIMYAAEQGQLQVLQWVMGVLCIQPNHAVLDWAIHYADQKNHKHIREFVLEFRKPQCLL